MVTRSKMGDGRSRRWQPRILHVDDNLPVDCQMMATSHLLPHVKQQGIVSLLSDVDGSFEDMTFTDFLLAALRRGDIHLFALSAIRLAQEGDAMVARVELR